ncbi:MAG: hypothetical protein CMN78_06475 [Spirochaetales bacterium]|nr:hypothetical protein [Spirochaetales bacterium]
MRKALTCITLGIILCSSAWADDIFIEIRAKKFSYTPNIVKVDRGDKVTIRLISEDVTHGLFIDGHGVEIKASPGEDGSIFFVADKAGRFNFRCSITCGEFHPFMVGYLVVRPNIRFYMFSIIVVAIGLASLAAIFLTKKKV